MFRYAQHDNAGVSAQLSSFSPAGGYLPVLVLLNGCEGSQRHNRKRCFATLNMNNAGVSAQLLSFSPAGGYLQVPVISNECEKSLKDYMGYFTSC